MGRPVTSFQWADLSLEELAADPPFEREQEP